MKAIMQSMERVEKTADPVTKNSMQVAIARRNAMIGMLCIDYFFSPVAT